ncbi:phosphatidic acid phosphatase [Chloroflexota bacterium]
MSKRIANLTSDILNPFLLSIVLILLLSLEAASSTIDGVKWSLILIAISIVPVFSVIMYLVRNRRLESPFVVPHSQRTKIYLLAVICAGVGCIILSCFEVPPTLIATCVAGFSTLVAFMCVNLLWKISIHTALVAASVTILIILYGSIAAITVVLVPLMVWARIELKQHSLAQAVAGTLLAALIVFMVFYLFGLV